MPWPIACWELAFYACVLLIWANGPAGGGPRPRPRLRAVGALGLLVLADAYHGGPDGRAWMTHQWWGILGLIGWSYLIARQRLPARARPHRGSSPRGRRLRRVLRGGPRDRRRRRIRAGPPSSPSGRWFARPPSRFSASSRASCSSAARARPQDDARALAPALRAGGGLVPCLLVAGALAAAGLHHLQDLRLAHLVPLVRRDLHRAVLRAFLLVDLRGAPGAVRWLDPGGRQPARRLPDPLRGRRRAARVELAPAGALGAGLPGLAFCVAWAFAVLGATALVARHLRLRL